MENNLKILGDISRIKCSRNGYNGYSISPNLISKCKNIIKSLGEDCQPNAVHFTKRGIIHFGSRRNYWW